MCPNFRINWFLKVQSADNESDIVLSVEFKQDIVNFVKIGLENRLFKCHINSKNCYLNNVFYLAFLYLTHNFIIKRLFNLGKVDNIVIIIFLENPPVLIYSKF